MAVEEIKEDHVIYVRFLRQPPQRLDVPELQISPEAVMRGKAFAVNDLSQVKVRLLEDGLATLRNPAASPPELVSAQERARLSRKGLWAAREPPPPTQPKASSSVSTPPELGRFHVLMRDSLSILSSILQWVWQWVFWLGSLGLGTAAITFFYRQFYIKRRVRLLIIGQPGAGKSAVYQRLLTPNVETEVIRSLAPSQAVARARRSNFVPRGRFEIHPHLTDVPGSAYSTVWDELSTHRAHALLLILAPTQLQKLAGDAIVDQRYLDQQLGYTQAFVQGGLGSRHTLRPRVVVMFLNKFDLLSNQPPDDSAGTASRTKVLRDFSEHIEVVTLAAKKAKVPSAIIVGSALENWNCAKIISVVGDELYGP